MWKKVLKVTVPLTLCLVLVLSSFAFTSCGGGGTTATEILIGASRDITGPQAGFQTYGFAPLYKAWIEEVNAAGGIDVGGKKLPVRLIEYDDASDTAACVRNIEKLCTQDHVNFLFGPTGTAMLFAAAPIANKNKTILLCGEGGATTLEPQLANMPYVFAVLNYSNHYQIPVFCDLIEAKGAKTVYICFMNDLHGAEYNLTMQSECGLRGITVVQAKSIPINITDFDPIVNEAKDLNPDVFCMFAYPDQNIPFMFTAMALNFNPKCLLIGPGCNFGFFPLTFGAALEGVCGEGAWNAKSSAAAAAFAAKVEPLVGGAGSMDWWGADVYQATLEYLKQAIEKAGTLDTEAILEVYRTTHFVTLLGDTYWDIQGNGVGGGLLPKECYLGQIGQWQNGVFEVVDNDANNTAPFIYPKPAWPVQ
ncbi:MAG: amino acid ABC transporter substrate-binding protein [Dehalococcoidales bacterium]|nr:amino acid ABC transporter substrate-binding protein [Dehalococcoidales bacterium]